MHENHPDLSGLKSVLKSAISAKISVLFFLFIKVNNMTLFISHYLTCIMPNKVELIMLMYVVMNTLKLYIRKGLVLFFD